MSLLSINTWLLSFCFIGVIVIAYGTAWFYRNSYDIKDGMRGYVLASIIYSVISFLAGLPLVLIVGMVLFGFIVFIFRNQHYFDKNR